MNLSRNWLNEFVDLHDITDKQFNDEMTLSGSKVETIERLDESLKNVVAGKILSMEKHPDSDHMWVCQLDVGREEPVQIVTGAWNIHIGDLVPAALHKSVLPGGVKIEKCKLRGVPSNGMLCSLKELGLTAEHDFPYAVITPAALLNDYHPIDPAKPSIPADIKPGDKVFGPVAAAKVLACAPQGGGTFHPCLDLGGTTAKVGLFTTSGALLEKWEVPTDTSTAGEHILENLADAIHAKMAEKEIPSEQVEGVGIGVPGPVLDSRIVAIICANLGGWGERNVSAQLSGLLDGMKVLVGNDANVAALGEIWMGTAKGCRSAVMVTLGTGVGGGVIVNGKVIDGAHGAGGEIGHITVNRHETATCGCGKHGCLEQYSSATGVVRCMKKLLDANPDTACTLRGKDFEAKDVFDAARAGDALAAREVYEMASTLGMALANIAATTDPEMFMIGGGVARAGEVLFTPLVRHYKEYAFQSCKETPIKAASLGNDAGSYGAVRLIVGA